MRQPGFRLDTSSRKATLEVCARGRLVLANPVSNRGTAFTPDERERLELVGLLPHRVTSIQDQVSKTYDQFIRSPSPLAKFIYLSQLRERNQVLYYRLLSEHPKEMLPIVYTPTIGEAIQRFSHEYVGTRGVFLSIDHPENIEAALRNYEIAPGEVDLVVVTDSEGILGIGDQGIGGIQIAIGKLGLYTAAAGIHPERAIPVVLDVGTNHLGLLHSDRYLGERHARVRGEEYDAFIDQFVEVVTRLFPTALIHWEDFGVENAYRILQRYADQVCSFNDDIQGTAAVVLAAVLAAVRRTGVPLHQHRFLIYGAGSAGVGIADMIQDVLAAEGRGPGEFYAFNSRGLIVEDGEGVRDFQRRYARSRAEIDRWEVADPNRITLLEAVRHAHPTILIGSSAQSGAFTEDVVRAMASYCERPVIMPLSNPTPRCEAKPADLLEWTDGRALIATGSPFSPVRRGDIHHTIAQANNALNFPCLGLGVAVSQARLVSPQMIFAAARALASLVNEHQPGAALLPGMSDLRLVAATVARAVGEEAERQGLARRPMTNPIQDIYQRMWKPDYPQLRIVDPDD